MCGDGGTHVIPVLSHQHHIDVRGIQHDVAQGMRPERNGGPGLEDIAAVPDGEERSARRVHRQRVEALDPRTPVGNVHRVRGTVERQPRTPAQATDVRTGFRADTV